MPSIQCGGWIGYIPLNDRHALEISPRVPIGNLERLIGLAEGYSPKVLHKYTRHFAHSDERPASLVDVVSDQLLAAFDGLWENGLLKTYERRQRVSSTPVGRIDAFATAWRTAKVGVPIAVSEAFHRTADFTPNRILRVAFEKLLARYSASGDPSERKRARRLRVAISRLEGVGPPTPSDMTLKAASRVVRRLPLHHESYADALMLAQLVISDSEFSIRGSDGAAILPSIIIDMEKVFEAYTRRILAGHFEANASIAVMDGNLGPPAGAMLSLFDPVEPSVKNVPVKPDIVIAVNGSRRLIIDAKYKPAPEQPKRDDINQVVLYGARYDIHRVVLLYAGRGASDTVVSALGQVGPYSVYNARIDLSAENIEAEESQLASAIEKLL